MKHINGCELIKDICPKDLQAANGGEISFCACVHSIRSGNGFSFVYLRTGRYVFQGIYSDKLCVKPISELCVGAYIRLSAKIKEEKRADYGFEAEILDFEILSKPESEYPLSIDDKNCNFSLESSLENRCTALRHPKQRAVFKITEGIVQGFQKFLLKEGFTQIFTPSLTKNLSEYDKIALRVKYFDSECLLAQSPQLYKQECVAFFDRVFEVGHSYCGKRRNSTRHLNEFIALDFEMAYVCNLDDIMNMQTAVLKSIFEYLQNYKNEFDLLGISLPCIKSIPAITFCDALKILKKTNQTDLDPYDEQKLYEYAKENADSDFVFVTHLPCEKQPFYMKNCETDNSLTESFSLLYKGVEIANGGVRINSYMEQVEKMKNMQIDCDEYLEFLSLHKHGMPPHGGCGMGLERFAMKLLDLENIRYASLFPRDLHLFN